MPTSCTDSRHPYYHQISELDPKNTANFFVGENSYRMTYVSLGEVLDLISFGGMNYVAWKLSIKNLTRFIKDWTDAQKPRIELERVQLSEHSYRLEEKCREYNYLWNKFHDDFGEELPFINHEHCPNNENHKGTFHDQMGRVRCAHLEIKKFKPSFIDSYHDYRGRIVYLENKPMEPLDDTDEKEWEHYQSQRSRFEKEERSFVVHDFCYSMIRDVGRYLPLEMVLSRLGVGQQENGVSAFPFSGFTLANFVKSWWNQEGGRRYFLGEGEEDSFRIYPDFEPISSED